MRELFVKRREFPFRMRESPSHRVMFISAGREINFMMLLLKLSHRTQHQPYRVLAHSDMRIVCVFFYSFFIYILVTEQTGQG